MKLILGDCLDKLKGLDDNSIDCILTDPPYGTTACSWDSVIPFEPMWVQLKRVIKPNGAIILFGCQPFTSALIMSNVKMFRYEWIWQKSTPIGVLNAKKMPLRAHENMLIFYSTLPLYNPQYTKGEPYIIKQGAPFKHCSIQAGDVTTTNMGIRYPISVIKYSNGNYESKHPTQKPVDLLKYLIKTYTQKGELVLDFTMGSGSTGVACLDTERDFIGIELDEKYFNVAQKRINDHIKKGIEVELFE